MIRVWIDKDALRANREDGGARPVFIVDDDVTGERGARHQVEILDSQGQVVARLATGPKVPTKGAGNVTAWVEAAAVRCADA